ncbi:MAG: methylated-DNA--[protein]-cysteine S-methyltransferase [Thermoanaerobaculia bacterium]|nr:methylated-DNA--[protein]-cysteine S-methyltransferase [Thermoanaerobaculia bacterium]
MNDYERIRTAIEYIAAEAPRQPGLEEVAARLALSPFHCQRLFRRWAGVSPKRFLQVLTVEHAKRLLDDSASVLDAALETGLSGPGRLHDHFVTLEALSPGEYKRRGEGLAIRWGTTPSPFGDALLGATDRGVCALAFPPHGDAGPAWLADQWPGADLVEDPAAVEPAAREIFGGGRVRLFARGTNFQVQVWRALLRIPSGQVASYASVAQAVGRPRAVRAVGSAVGANRVAFLIPCHRVIRSAGGLGGYRWGTDRKRALLAWEAARATAQSPPVLAGSARA